jgi:hypothetical protein
MELQFKLNKSADFIFDCLTHSQKFVAVHPAIYRIDETGENTWLVHEKLNFGFFPFSFSYPAVIENNRLDQTVLIRATVFKLVKVEMKFVLQPFEGYTTVVESISFKSPLPVEPVMRNLFRKQHQLLFENMNAREE